MKLPSVHSESLKLTSCHHVGLVSKNCDGAHGTVGHYFSLDFGFSLMIVRDSDHFGFDAEDAEDDFKRAKNVTGADKQAAPLQPHYE